jgi:hypothetical protein
MRFLLLDNPYEHAFYSGSALRRFSTSGRISGGTGMGRRGFFDGENFDDSVSGDASGGI